MIYRALPPDMTLDGRTVEGVVVPYDEPAEVCDDYGPAPVYREVFTETSFARQLQGFAARPALMSRIILNLDHRRELDHEVGFTESVTSTPAGLVARFKLRPTANLELVRSMLAETHTGLSVECALIKSRTRPDGVVERRTAVLVGVAAVPVPAYAGAGITALRADDAAGDRPTPLLDAIAARWGFAD
jgi:HK97 family phage prohead protease